MTVFPSRSRVQNNVYLYKVLTSNRITRRNDGNRCVAFDDAVISDVTDAALLCDDGLCHFYFYSKRTNRSRGDNRTRRCRSRPHGDLVVTSVPGISGGGEGEVQYETRATA